jgi:predicted PurR-regulated permease PerM
LALSDTGFFRRTLIVLAVIASAALAWRLREVEFLLFGSILVAVALRRLMRPVARVTRFGEGMALGVTITGLLLALALFGAFLGWRLQAQVSEATELLPQGFGLLMQKFRSDPLGNRLLEGILKLRMEQALPALGRLPFFALSAASVVVSGLAVLVGGVYLAVQPRLYRSGLLGLLPPGARGWTDGMFDEAAVALHRWLVAQFVGMASVGALVGLGVWLIGVPAPMALGLFAGLAEFVPVASPIVSAVPALLLALLSGLDKAAWTLALFVLVQQFENNVLLPLVQRRFAALPPVVTLFAILSFSVVFGPLGALLGVPLTVVAMVVVKRLHPHDASTPEDKEVPVLAPP